MNRLHQALLLAIGVALVCASPAAVATAAAPMNPQRCTGTLAGEYAAIVVPKGSACTLSGAHVLGDVTVRPGADFTTAEVGDQVTLIDGNVVGRRPDSLMLRYKAQVGGNFLVRGASNGDDNGFDIGVVIGGDATIAHTAGVVFVDSGTVTGDLRIHHNSGYLRVNWNQVGGHLALRHNVASHAASVIHNTVGGSMAVKYTKGRKNKVVQYNSVTLALRCHHNSDPFTGTDNTAQSMFGQCS